MDLRDNNMAMILGLYQHDNYIMLPNELFF